MPDSRRLPSTNRSRQPNPEFDIIVKEPIQYPWPRGVGTIFGRPARRIRYYFEPFLDAIRSIRKDYLWFAFYQDPDTGTSYLEKYPEILSQLERLFEDELGTKYSPQQYQLLVQSHIVIVAVSKKNLSIAGYFSSTYADRNTIPGVSIPIIFGCHGVIAQDHQQYNIGVTMGAITTLHGQKLRDLFRTIACVLRTNNKHILNPLRQAGTVYRSDELADEHLDDTQLEARSAIKYMHSELFRLSNVPLPFYKPIDIEHRFDPAFTIEGVRSDQIIYICCVTSLSRCIYKLFARRPRRKRAI